MYRLIGTVLILGLIFFHANVVWSLDTNKNCTDKILISEIQTGSADSASEEFIELYNTSDARIDLSEWEIQKTASSDNTTSIINLNGIIEPRGFYLLSSESYLEDAHEIFSFNLAKTGGHIRIVKQAIKSDLDEIIQAEQVCDLVGWGSAQGPEGDDAAPSSSNGESIRRSFSDEGYMVDTDNNFADFIIELAPSPRATLPSIEEQDDESIEEKESDAEAGLDEQNSIKPEQTYHKLEISELMIDPISPAVDSEDEFVELYNPNEITVNLKDYVLKTGSMLQYEFMLPEIKLSPKQYMALYSSEGTITLTNGGGKVQLLDPNKQIASETVIYEKAPAGAVYAKIQESWHWSNIVTPNKRNLLGSIKKSINKPQRVAARVKSNKSYHRLLITEVLPDPVSPQKDKDDEFVEVHNPNSFPVNAKGYVINTGTSYRNKFKISDITLQAGEYRAFYSKDGNISLNNQGNKPRLLDPNGKVLSQLIDYKKAHPGSAWAIFEDGWKWTTIPTPGAKNIYRESQLLRNTDAVKSVSVTDKAIDIIASPAAVPTSSATKAVIASVTIIALLYAIYEYRYDVQNKIYFIRRYLENRGADRR